MTESLVFKLHIIVLIISVILLYYFSQQRKDHNSVPMAETAASATGQQWTPVPAEDMKFGVVIEPTLPPRFKYSIVPGLFEQSTPDTDPDKFDFRKRNFGLLLRNERGEPDWKALVNKVDELNANARSWECYKVLYLARHGQGFHNVAIETYGYTAWNEKWSKIGGDGISVWGPDPDLTATGIAEATYANSAWKEQISRHGLLAAGAIPQKFYCSPFTRAAHTCKITWNDIVFNISSPPRPFVREKIRETIGRHLCDKRGKRSDLEVMFPTYEIEDGLTEDDEWWRADLRESNPARAERMRDALDDIFMEDGNTWISVTAHSGCIQSALSVLGHRKFYLQTGGMIPVVVRAQLLDKKAHKLPESISGISYGPVESIEENAKNIDSDEEQLLQLQNPTSIPPPNSPPN